jgi:hypothetical protein
MTAVHDRTALDSTRFLRLVLTLDSALCALNGVAYLVGAAYLGDLFGLPAELLVTLGVFLVGVAGALLWLATRQRISRVGVGVIVALNALWAVDSIALLAAGWYPVTAIGQAWVVVQALAVAVVAALEYVGLRRLPR